ncbi:MAG: GatB/YqeY domain-containing protein [Candidatus Omnitrophota bacterium]
MLEDKIYQDYIQALKAKDKKKRDFLSLIRSDLKNQAINLKKDKLDNDQALPILKKAQKRLLDAKESIAKSQRSDLLNDLEEELKILSQYLPQPITESELSEIVNKVINELSASSMKDMGLVMKEVLARVGVRADSQKVSSLVKQNLSA